MKQTQLCPPAYMLYSLLPTVIHELKFYTFEYFRLNNRHFLQSLKLILR